MSIVIIVTAVKIAILAMIVKIAVIVLIVIRVVRVTGSAKLTGIWLYILGCLGFFWGSKSSAFRI